MEQLKEEYQLPVYLFHEGKNYEAYRFFGVHKIKKGTYAFRVWAPHAVGVAVAGDFNDWSETANPMTLIAPEIWEAVVDGVSKSNDGRSPADESGPLRRAPRDPTGHRRQGL